MCLVNVVIHSVVGVGGEERRRAGYGDNKLAVVGHDKD